MYIAAVLVDSRMYVQYYSSQSKGPLSLSCSTGHGEDTRHAAAGCSGQSCRADKSISAASSPSAENPDVTNVGLDVKRA
jgi:hypothetical protein